MLSWDQIKAEVEQLGQHGARLEAELRSTPAQGPDHWWSAAKSLSDQLQRLEVEEWVEPNLSESPAEHSPAPSPR